MPKCVIVSENRLGARAVALHGGGTPYSRKLLLEEIGVIAEAEPGVRVPVIESVRGRTEPGKVIDSIDLDNKPVSKSLRTEEPPLRNRSTIPEGLRNLAPPTPAVVIAVRKIPQIDPTKCGTLSGRAKHSKRNKALEEAGLPRDPSCDICRPFFTKYQRECKARKKAAQS